MDRGATVTWDWAFAWKDKEPTEISAIQHAYNILIDLGDSVFASECQNEPIRQSFGLEMLPADMIMRKQSPYSRGQVPPECDVLVSKIDVHSQILYWHVWAFGPDFTGYLVDHGVFPEQGRQLFAHTTLPRPLKSLFPQHDHNSTIFAGLKALNEGCDALQWTGLLQRRWTRTDGVPMRIQRQHIDASGEAKEAVIGYTRASAFAAVITPAYGKGISARVKPISEWQGATVRRSPGPEWAYVKPKPDEPQSVLFDSNYWKTRFHRGLALPEGSQGALYVFKDDPAAFRRLAAHWLAETPKATYSEGRLVFEFVNQPGRDNHDLDCAVGCLVAASQCGVSHIPKPPKRMKKSLQQYHHDAQRA